MARTPPPPTAGAAARAPAWRSAPVIGNPGYPSVCEDGVIYTNSSVIVVFANAMYDNISALRTSSEADLSTRARAEAHESDMRSRCIQFTHVFVYEHNSDMCMWTKQLTSGVTPKPRLSVAYASCGDNLYLFGGITASGARTNAVYRFNVVSYRWDLLYSPGGGAASSGGSLSSSGAVPASMPRRRSTNSPSSTTSTPTSLSASASIGSTPAGSVAASLASSLSALDPTAAPTTNFTATAAAAGGAGGNSVQSGDVAGSECCDEFPSDPFGNAAPCSSGALLCCVGGGGDGSGSSGDTLYVCGGRADNGVVTNDVHAFDTVERLWQRIDTDGVVPARTYRRGGCVYDGRMYVWGGVYADSDEAQTYDSVPLYSLDLHSFEWRQHDGVSVAAGVGNDGVVFYRGRLCAFAVQQANVQTHFNGSLLARFAPSRDLAASSDTVAGDIGAPRACMDFSQVVVSDVASESGGGGRQRMVKCANAPCWRRGASLSVSNDRLYVIGGSTVKGCDRSVYVISMTRIAIVDSGSGGGGGSGGSPQYSPEGARRLHGDDAMLSRNTLAVPQLRRGGGGGWGDESSDSVSGGDEYGDDGDGDGDFMRQSGRNSFFSERLTQSFPVRRDGDLALDVSGRAVHYDDDGGGGGGGGGAGGEPYALDSLDVQRQLEADQLQRSLLMSFELEKERTRKQRDEENADAEQLRIRQYYDASVKNSASLHVSNADIVGTAAAIQPLASGDGGAGGGERVSSVAAVGGAIAQLKLAAGVDGSDGAGSGGGGSDSDFWADSDADAMQSGDEFSYGTDDTDDASDGDGNDSDIGGDGDL